MLLVLDDMKIIRELLVECLSTAGHEVIAAPNAPEANAIIELRKPDLLILDLHMPGIDGMSFLAALRSRPATAVIPVIILTGLTDRRLVIQASKLGVREYMLKANFCVKELLERVERALGGTSAASSAVASTAAAPAPAVKPSPAVSAPGVEIRITQPAPAAKLKPLTTREDIIQRAEHALSGRSLSGMVAEVISMAASPRTSTTDLSAVIVRDPMLAANVLRVANSAAYASARGHVSNIPDAIKKIGCSTVGRVAASIAVIDAMPDNLASGFNPVRAWQHSFAVAQLCQHLAPQESEAGGIPYLVGLCHDLSEILFHAHFTDECRKVIEFQLQTGRPRAQIERELLGITQAQLVPVVLGRLSLPDTIRTSIVAYHEALAGGTPPSDPMARVLWLAELYANGILLASSPNSLISPVTQALCKQAHGKPHPSCPDAVTLRAEVYCLTTLMAQLSSRDGAELASPILPRRKARIWLARDDAFSTFDPLEAALGSLADLAVNNRQPTMDEAQQVDGVVIATTAANKVADPGALALRSGRTPLILTTAPSATHPAGTCALPISLAALHQFIGSVEAGASLAA